MKPRFKFILCAAVILSMLMSTVPASAAVKDTKSVDKMLSYLEQQNFSQTVSKESVEKYINHFTYDSKYAAFYGKKFDYPNKGKKVKTISDGTYTINDINGKGCYAYAKFVSKVIYGKHGSRMYHTEKAGKLTGEGLKKFLLQEAQAGEHLRIDDTHSVVFISGDEKGFYYFHYNGDSYGQKILLIYKTYADFAAKYNKVSSSEKSSIWLYNANTNKNAGAAASSQIMADGIYVITTKLDSDFALDISGASEEDGANLQLWEKNQTPAQSFKVSHLGNGYYQIINTNSGKALDAEGGGTVPGTNVWQYQVNHTDAQIWKITGAGNGYHYIICKKSGLYLDLNNANVDYGENIKLWDKNGHDAQMWKFTKAV